jgi:hypothetical protein
MGNNMLMQSVKVFNFQANVHDFQTQFWDFTLKFYVNERPKNKRLNASELFRFVQTFYTLIKAPSYLGE